MYPSQLRPVSTFMKPSVSSATKNGFGALLRASKSGELERVAATLPVDAAPEVAPAAVSHGSYPPVAMKSPVANQSPQYYVKAVC